MTDVSLRSIVEAHLASLEIGETQRLNHVDCPAGEDTRRRLYITMKPDVCLAYCHNCGNSWSKYVTSNDRYRFAPGAVTPITAEYTKPTLVSFADHDGIPSEATGWRYKAMLSRTQCEMYGIYYAPDTNAIYIPFIDMKGDHAGHQLRPLNRRGGAKYINYMKDGDKELGGLLYVRTGNSTVVIVEDYASAVHVAEAGYNTLVNYGTNVKPQILHELATRHYDHIVVWLDNDSPIVNQKAKDIVNILSLFNNRDSYKVHQATVEKEPKHLESQYIVEIVEGAKHG